MRYVFLLALIACREPTAPKHGAGCWLEWRDIAETSDLTAAIRIHYDRCPTVIWDAP